MNDDEHLTPRQQAAQAALKKAERAYRISWGDRTRTLKQLQAANRECVEADVEASHMALKEDNREGVRR